MNATTWLRSEWDRVAGFTLIAIGALFLIFGYLGVKDTPFVAEELAYIASGGLGGLFCLGLGVGLLLSADLHDEWRKLDRIESVMRGQPLPDPAAVLAQLQKNESVEPPTNGERPGGTPGPLVSHGPAKAGGALAVTLDWTGQRFRRGLATAGLSLVVPAAMLAIGWRRANTTGDYQVAAVGIGIAVLGLCLTLAVIGLYSLWLRARVAGRQAHLFGAYIVAGQAPADETET
ncbi:MAG: hypothetical protein ACRDYF_03070 [Acidimicrobiia bacterium]